MNFGTVTSADFGLILAGLSALATAVSHAWVKAGGDKLAVQVWIRLTGFVLALPFAIAVGPPPAALWPWLIGAAAIHAVYQLTLNHSYTLSDFSTAFPIARGIAPLLVALGGAVWLGDRMGTLHWVGIATIVVGIALVARYGAITTRGFLAAAAAGALTTAYSLVDAKGVRIAPEPLVFIAWFYLCDGVSMPALFALRRTAGQRRTILWAERRTGLYAAFGALAAFVPALFAFRYAPAGAVSAIRETSVVGALLIGHLWLGEKPGWRHWLSALGVAGGAALLVTAS